MNNKLLPNPPDLRNRLTVPLITGMIIAVVVLVALPLSQMISRQFDPEIPEIETTAMEPPDMVELEKPEEEEKPKEEIKEFEEEIRPPTLGELEVILNPNLGGFGNADYTVPISLGSGIEEITYLISELTNPPRPLSQQAPLYPPELKGQGLEGEAILYFVVRQDGTTADIRIEEATHPSFGEAARRSVRKWLFEPGEKDGRKVNTRVRIKIPFTIH